MNLEPWQWVFAVLGALIIGISKAGITGAGMLTVVIYAEILPARQATGVILPMLVLGDVLGVRIYHAHAQWRHLIRLFPSTAVGVVLGYFALGRISDLGARLMIGAIVLFLIVMHVARTRQARGKGRPTSPSRGARGFAGSPLRSEGRLRDEEPITNNKELPSRALAPVTGILAGFTTLVANAAGPLMSVYLLAMRLPKLEFVGTAAVFFLLLNVFKVPFMVHLGLIDWTTVKVNLMLAPAVVAGSWIGWKLLPKINQALFERLVLGLSALAGLDLCLRTLWMLLG